MPVQAPIQNQSYLNKDVAFFAPASTLGASELGDAPNFVSGFLDFGQGGVLTGVGLRVAPVTNGVGGATSTLAVLDDTGTARSFAANGIYFDTPGGSLTSCSIIYQNTPAFTVDTANIKASNINMNSLVVSNVIDISTINGIPYSSTPASALYTVQAGFGVTIASNAAIITFDTPFSSASTLSITATPNNFLNTTFHPLTLSAISQSTFTITSDATNVGFNWIANGPV